jgi:hypothetical protein
MEHFLINKHASTSDVLIFHDFWYPFSLTNLSVLGGDGQCSICLERIFQIVMR